METNVTSVRETERKYEATGDLALSELVGLLGPDRGGQAQEDLLAVYFDTPDLRLVAAGITLRRREGGTDAGWHLKLPAGGDSRDELRVPLSRAVDQPPDELVSLTTVHTRGASLVPVARLSTRRSRWVLADSAGRGLVELVEDQVSAQAVTAEGVRKTETAWREVEVELIEPDQVKLLDRIERRLLKAGARRSGSSSKLSRVLGDQLPTRSESPEPSRKSSAGEVVLAYLRTQAEQLRRYDPLVRQDAPDAVHQMRVAARRMRSALQAFGRVLDRDQAQALAAELKWVAGELGAARDSEVMAERVAEMVAELPDELVLGPVSAATTRAFQGRQRDARAVSLAALDSDRYLALQDAIDELLTSPPLTRRATRPARRELPRSVRRAYRRTRKRMCAVDSHAPVGQRDEALHETRKAVKRLRYSIEAAGPALGKPASRLRRRVKVVQGLLGDHQDTVVARPVLRELAVHAHLEGGNGFSYGLMHASEAARADRALDQLPARWRQLDRSKNTKWLAK